MVNKRSAVTVAIAFVCGIVCSPNGRAQATQTLVPSSPSFEVASVKKHPPASDVEKAMGFRMGGPDVSQYRASNVTAKMLIATAYGVNEFQIADGPTWISSERWDIDAKVDDSLAAQLQKLPRVQQQAQQALMLRSLLVDRFKLQITRGTKEGTVMTLVVAKGGPKLKEVPPPDPTGPGLPPGPITPGQFRTPPPGQALVMMNNRLVTLAANAVPIANLVSQLSAQIGQQVVDDTGLNGTYQFTLQFSPQGLKGGPPPETEAVPDNNTASIFTALQEQLGLKLESAKGAVDTITIDHIEEPAAN